MSGLGGIEIGGLFVVYWRLYNGVECAETQNDV